MALDWKPTFEGTATADLQAMHDILKGSILDDGVLATGVASYQVFARTVTKLSLKERLQALSAFSDELARRRLPDRDEIHLVDFGDATSGPNPQVWGFPT